MRNLRILEEEGQTRSGGSAEVALSEINIQLKHNLLFRCYLLNKYDTTKSEKFRNYEMKLGKVKLLLSVIESDANSPNMTNDVQGRGRNI